MEIESPLTDVALHIRAAESLVADLQHDQQNFVPPFDVGVDPALLKPVLDLLPAAAPKGLVEFLARTTLPQRAPRASYTYTLPKGRVVNSSRDYCWLPRQSCTPQTVEELYDNQINSAPSIYILPGGLLGFLSYYEYGDGDMIAYDIESGSVLNVDVGASYEPSDGDDTGVYYSRVWGSVLEFVEEHVVRKQSFPPNPSPSDSENEYWKEYTDDAKHVGPINENALFHPTFDWGSGVLAQLIANGADLEHRNSLDQTPLLRAASLPFAAGTVKSLLSFSPDLEVTDLWGNTALMLAARNGEVEYVQALLEAGASKTKRDPLGRTARDLISRFDHQRTKLFNLL